MRWLDSNPHQRKENLASCSPWGQKELDLLCDSTELNFELNTSCDTVKCNEKDKWKNDLLEQFLRQKIICQNCSKPERKIIALDLHILMLFHGKARKTINSIFNSQWKKYGVASIFLSYILHLFHLIIFSLSREKKSNSKLFHQPTPCPHPLLRQPAYFLFSRYSIIQGVVSY